MFCPQYVSLTSENTAPLEDNQSPGGWWWGGGGGGSGGGGGGGRNKNNSQDHTNRQNKDRSITSEPFHLKWSSSIIPDSMLRFCLCET